LQSIVSEQALLELFHAAVCGIVLAARNGPVRNRACGAATSFPEIVRAARSVLAKV
jgi:hypothetical protein